MGKVIWILLYPKRLSRYFINLKALGNIVADKILSFLDNFSENKTWNCM